MNNNKLTVHITLIKKKKKKKKLKCKGEQESGACFWSGPQVEGGGGGVKLHKITGKLRTSRKRTRGQLHKKS